MRSGRCVAFAGTRPVKEAGREAPGRQGLLSGCSSPAGALEGTFQWEGKGGTEAPWLPGQSSILLKAPLEAPTKPHFSGVQTTTLQQTCSKHTPKGFPEGRSLGSPALKASCSTPHPTPPPAAGQ